MNSPSLVMPMAGRGSRFAKNGLQQPKPLIDLFGKPFFWWAAESALRGTAIQEMVFVVLDEHIAEWRLDAQIREFYPHAKIVAIPEVTAGSAETGMIGASAISSSGPIIINDCDHAFVASGLGAGVKQLLGRQGGTLLTFPSTSPNYSYVALDTKGAVIATVEKKVVSPFAVAGCYLFSSPELYAQQYKRYVDTCPYKELFISGIYTQMIAEGLDVEMVVVDRHVAFGTPEEYESVTTGALTGMMDTR